MNPINKIVLQTSAEGTETFSDDRGSEVLLCSGAVPSKDGPNLPTEAFPYIRLNSPGNMDDEAELTLCNFHPTNGCADVASVCLSLEELVRLHAHVGYLIASMKSEP